MSSKREWKIKKKNAKFRSDCRQSIVQLQRYMMCCEVSTSMKRSSRWALVGRIRQMLTILSTLPVKKKIQFWMLGGIQEAHSSVVQFLKIIVTSSRRLHHVSMVDSSISKDLAIIYKFVGNHNEDLLHAVLCVGSLVSEGQGLLYKSQTKAYSVIIKCVLQEYFCVDGGTSSKWLCWCGVLLTHLWLICSEPGDSRVEALSFILPRLPQKLMDIYGNYQQTGALIMQNMDSIVQLAPIHLQPFPNDLWQKFDNAEIVEFVDSAGIPYKISQKLHRCAKDVRCILQSQTQMIQTIKQEMSDGMETQNQIQICFNKSTLIDENEESDMKLFVGPSKIDSSKEINLYVELSTLQN